MVPFTRFVHRHQQISSKPLRGKHLRGEAHAAATPAGPPGAGPSWHPQRPRRDITAISKELDV